MHVHAHARIHYKLERICRQAYIMLWMGSGPQAIG